MEKDIDKLESYRNYLLDRLIGMPKLLNYQQIKTLDEVIPVLT